MQDPEFRKQLASIHEEVKEFSDKYSDTYLGKIGENPLKLASFIAIHMKL